MSIFVGGLRARLIKDSIYEMLYYNLQSLGWFTPSLKRSNITFPSESVPVDEQVPLNTLVLADETLDTEPIELGSNLGEASWQFFVDFYAENDTLGLHLIRDVKDILEGRMLSIGRSFPVIDIYDYSAATPEKIFDVLVEDVRVDKAHNQLQPWLRHWYSCEFTIIDSYNSETD